MTDGWRCSRGDWDSQLGVQCGLQDTLRSSDSCRDRKEGFYHPYILSGAKSTSQ